MPVLKIYFSLDNKKSDTIVLQLYNCITILYNFIQFYITLCIFITSYKKDIGKNNY